MCTILLAWRCLLDGDLVIAANRDELVGRPSLPPSRLSDDPLCFGGRDLLAGGTWLAVTRDGRVAAVTNRRHGGDEVRRDPTRRSRGELPLALLCADPLSMRAALEQIAVSDYNPFNGLVVSRQAAFVVHAPAAERRDIVELQPGLHVLCVHDVDDSVAAKEVRLRRMLLQRIALPTRVDDCVTVMRAMLCDHHSPTGDGRDSVCIHGDEYGTVSASLVVLRRDAKPAYSYAAGRPCVTPFTDVTLD